MIKFLSAMKEETPAWLLNHKPGDRIDLAEIMKSRSVAYPGSGDDGRAIKLFSQTHAAHVFFYMDPSGPSDTTLRGYHLLDRIDCRWGDFGMKPFLFPIEEKYRPIFDQMDDESGYFALTTLYPGMNDEIWRFILEAQKSGDPELGRGREYFRESLHSPWISLDSRIGSLLIYERDPDLGEEHGIRRIALFLITVDAIPAYAAIWGSPFCQTGPTFLVVQTDMITCGLFTRTSPLSLVASVMNRFPDYILGRELDDPPRIIWEGYTMLKDVKPRSSKDCSGKHWYLFRRSF